MKKKNIYIFYSSNKGGHRFPAEALSEYLKLNYGHLLNINLFNLLDYSPVGAILDRIGRWGDLYLPMFWRKGYTQLATNRQFFTTFSKFSLNLILANTLFKLVKFVNNKTDLILSFQAEVNTLFPFIRRKISNRLETVIVDYSAHSLWINNEIDTYYVGNNFVAEKVIKLNVPNHKIIISGIPQKLSFLNVLKTSIRQQRKTLNLNPDLPTFIPMGGYLGKMVDYGLIIKSIIQTNLKCQLVVVFGKNTKAYRKCIPLINQAKITIKPFVAIPDIANVMWAADIIITKPGAVTISEALTLGKPMILVTPKAGSAQEHIFAKNIQDAGAGIHIPKVEAVGNLLKKLSEDQELLSNMAKKSYALGELNRNSNKVIAEGILTNLGLI